MRTVLSWLKSHPKTTFLLGLAVVLWVSHEVLNWRAERQWQAYKAAGRARGMPMELADVIPPMVADAENFASAPLVASMFGKVSPFALPEPATGSRASVGNRVKGEPTDWAKWQQEFLASGLIQSASSEPARDVLLALDTFGPKIAQWREAARRPHSRFPVEYDKGVAMALPHLSSMHAAARFFALRTRAHLAVGESAAAYEDICDGLQISRALEHEPLIISGLVRISTLALVLDAAGDGLAEHRWAEPELARLEGVFATIHPLLDYQFAMRTERAGTNKVYDDLVAMSWVKRGQFCVALTGGFGSTGADLLGVLLPKRFFRENQLLSNQYADQMLGRLPVVMPAGGFDPKTPTLLEKVDQFPDTHFYALFRMMAPVYTGIESRYLEFQTSLDQARLAVALERAWLATGQYPETLSELVPQYLPAVATDIYSGRPFTYQRVGPASFRLYGVGPNRLDEGGSVDRNLSERKQLDQIWLYAPKAAPVVPN